MSATELKEKKNNPSPLSTDTVRVYLQEIGRFPMLDPSEEITFGKQERAHDVLSGKETNTRRTKEAGYPPEGMG